MEIVKINALCAGLITSGWQRLVSALRVNSARLGKGLTKVSISEVLFQNFVDDRPRQTHTQRITATDDLFPQGTEYGLFLLISFRPVLWPSNKCGARSGYACLLTRLRIKAKAIMNNITAKKAVDHFDKAGTLV